MFTLSLPLLIELFSLSLETDVDIHWSKNGVLSISSNGASLGYLTNANELASALFTYYTIHQKSSVRIDKKSEKKKKYILLNAF